MLKKTSLVLAATLTCGAMSAQSVTYPVAIDATHFPDATLRGIISTKVYDRDGDGQLSQAEAERVTSIDISERGISDVTGIEYFVNVEELYVYSNNISTLNLAPFAKLVDLACGTNPIATLDLAANPDLTYLACGEANLTTLNTAANKKLQAVICNSNALTALDFSANTQLVDLNCADNQLTTLNISGCSALANLDCSNNALTALDLAGKQKLTLVYCKNNKIESLNLSSATMLMCLECDNNALAALNLDGIVLQYSNNISNQSRSIDLDANGAVDLTTLDPKCMDVSRISDLSGGTLDGTTLTFAGETVTYKYATKCKNTQYGSMDVTLTANKKPVEELLPIDEEHFPDEAFRNVLLQTDYDKDGDGYFSKSEIAALTSMDAYGKGIKDLSGIKYLTALQSFTCRHNALTTLDVSALPELKVLNCSENALTSLNISQNAKLRELDANNNALTTIDLSGNPSLALADLSDNQLTILDLSYNPNLGFIGCSNNLLTTLDASVCPKMEAIYCSNNQIRTLNLSNNKELGQVNCDGNALVAVDFSATNLIADLSAIIGNRRTVTLESGNILDLSTLAADGLNVSRMNNIVGGTLEGNILTFTSETVTYDYDTKSASGSYATIGITLHADNFKKDGIDDVTAEDDAPVEYYNLQGIRIDADNLTPGIYIRRQGSASGSRVTIVK